MSFGTHKCSRKSDPGQADSCVLYRDKTIGITPSGRSGRFKNRLLDDPWRGAPRPRSNYPGGGPCGPKTAIDAFLPTLWNARSRFCFADRRHRARLELGAASQYAHLAG
jgi:hypothetical protein